MFMRFLGGGVGYIATEVVDRFEQQVHEMLGLIEDTVRDVGVVDIDMGDNDVASISMTVLTVLLEQTIC